LVLSLQGLLADVDRALSAPVDAGPELDLADAGIGALALLPGPIVTDGAGGRGRDQVAVGAAGVDEHAGHLDLSPVAPGHRQIHVEEPRRADREGAHRLVAIVAGVV